MKLVGAIIVIIVFGFIGYIATVITALMGGVSFYAPFVAISTIAIMVFTILAIYGQIRKRQVKVSMIVFVSLCVISVTIYELYQNYLDSLEVISTQDVNLFEYRPFEGDTKAVFLDEEASLKLENNLPKLDGATALYPVYAGFVQAVYPKKEYPLYESEVVSTQTNRAFESLLDGSVDIIFMAHPSKKQLQRAEQLGIELQMTPIGKEAFVFFVNNRNPVEQLTIKQIQGIYSGQITNWIEVGGNNEPIQAFQRPEGSGSQTALQHVMNEIPLMDPPKEDIVSARGGIIEQTSNFQNHRNAIGFSFRFFSEQMVQNGNIQNISIEGISPTKEHIQNGTYPIANYFYAITAGSENPNIKPFIEWILSEQGQRIVEMTGYVAVHEY